MARKYSHVERNNKGARWSFMQRRELFLALTSRGKLRYQTDKQ
jgi:hypothetical protein